MMRLSHATDATLPSTFPRPIFLPPIPRPSSDPSLSSLSLLFPAVLLACSFFCPGFSRSPGPTSFVSFFHSFFLFSFRSATGTSNAFKQSLYLRFDTPGDTSARNNERKTFPRGAACESVSVDFCPSLSACLLPSALLPSTDVVEIHVL